MHFDRGIASSYGSNLLRRVLARQITQRMNEFGRIVVDILHHS